MPLKRSILDELTIDELRASLDYYELEVDDRRVKAQVADALARSRKARIGDVLYELSRDRLKQLCRAFGLTRDAGRQSSSVVSPAAVHPQSGLNERRSRRRTVQVPKQRCC